MSVKSRPPIPRNAPRTALPQLETVLARQGRSKAWLAAQLGMARQAWHNNEAAGGWPDTDVPRIAGLLGVSADVLKARGVVAPDAGPSVRALLLQPELATLAESTLAAVRQQMETLVAQAVSETVRLLADGAVPMPSAGTVRALSPTRLAALEREVESQPREARPILERRGHRKRAR